MKKKTEEITPSAEEQVKTEAVAEETVVEKTAEKAAGKAVPAKSEKPAPSKSDKTKVKTNKKPNIFKRMWRKLREVFGELKKVTWPTFRKSVGQTGVVLVVVLFFIIIIGAANAGFLALYKLLPGMQF